LRQGATRNDRIPPWEQGEVHREAINESFVVVSAAPHFTKFGA
jgi:hypothetical protein